MESSDAENIRLLPREPRPQYGTGDSSTRDSVTIDIEDESQPLLYSKFLPEEYTEELVNTEYGDVTVAIKGDLSNPTILTYHDLGLNYISNFKGLFNVPFSADIVKNFCIVHVNAPGQEEGARVIPEDFEYPDMDQLAEQVNDVINHFGIDRFVGIGVGLGANVLIRHVLKVCS